MGIRPRDWFGPRSRLRIGVNVAIAVIVALVGLYVGARNPFGYGLTVVGAFMLIFFLRVGATAREERRAARETERRSLTGRD
jgi:hypothetical protein